MNKKRRDKKSRRIYIIVLVVILFVGGSLYTLLVNKKINYVSNFLKDGVVVIEKVLFRPFSSLTGTIGDFFSLKGVLEENKILKSNIDKVESLEAENIELKQEIFKLKEELNVDHVLSDYEYLNATVINRNTLYWYNNLTIDKGRHNGIKEGMVVMNSTGLIGKTVNVGEFSSDVKLITTNDTNNKISVAIVNNGNKLMGVINGYNYDKGYLKVEGISNTETVSIGDIVYTSGLGGVFPSGILIGTVESITTDVFDLSKIINVKPSASFRDINYVTVLKRTGSK